MLRKAILHIGPMKTGSTSIQLWLRHQTDALAEAGFLVPRSLARNMSRLSYMAQAHAKGDPLSDTDAARLEALRQEIAALPTSIHTVVFSGEMLGQHLTDQTDVRALKALFDEFFDRYTVILYLRRQDELSLSHYSTSLRRGAKRARPLGGFLDYEGIFEPWIGVFGRDSIRPRIFDRETMLNGDVVRDFADAAGLPFEASEEEEVLDRNPSLLPQAQVFLAMLAEQVRDSGFEGSFSEITGREVVNRYLSTNFRGKGIRPARGDVMAGFDEVRASNERIRSEWFPDRRTLFDEDFSSYPDVETEAPTSEQLLEVTMGALVTMVTSKKIAGASNAAKARRADKQNYGESRRAKRREQGGERRARRTKKSDSL